MTGHFTSVEEVVQFRKSLSFRPPLSPSDREALAPHTSLEMILSWTGEHFHETAEHKV